MFGRKPKSINEQIKEQQNQLIQAQKLQKQRETLADQKRQLARLRNQNLNAKLKPIMQTIKPVGKILGNLWNSIPAVDPVTFKKIPTKQIKKIKIKKQKTRPKKIVYY